MMWLKDAFSDDAWRCRVSQSQWRWMAVLQARGVATKNARSPIVVRHEDGVTRADVDEDRSLFLISTSATRRSSLVHADIERREQRVWTIRSIMNYMYNEHEWEFVYVLLFEWPSVIDLIFNDSERASSATATANLSTGCMSMYYI